MAEEHEQNEDTFNANARGGWLTPLDLVEFLELLRNNGNVSMSARLIGRSRSTIYAFAATSASFKEAMREAMIEGRELLLGEGWRRAYNFTEFTDTTGKTHVAPPSDRLLSQLIGGYFNEFRPGHKEDSAPDELLPDSADLTKLSDAELESLERILSKVGADDSVGARQG